MRRKLTAREVFLLVVLGAAALAVLYYLPSDPGAGDGGLAGRGKDGGEVGTAPLVAMALLTREPEAFDPNGRDLFKFAERPLTRAELEARRRAEEAARLRREEEARRRRELAETRRKAEQARQQATPAVRGPAVAAPPRADFRYLGYLGPKDAKIAVFDNGGDEVLLARQGEVIQDEFFVKEINYGVVVLGYTKEEFRSRTTELSMNK